MEKKGIEISMIIYWLTAITILAVIVISYIVLRGKGISAVDYIKNLFRFG